MKIPFIFKVAEKRKLIFAKEKAILAFPSIDFPLKRG
jgi:hypothetical protein